MDDDDDESHYEVQGELMEKMDHYNAWGIGLQIGNRHGIPQMPCAQR